MNAKLSRAEWNSIEAPLTRENNQVVEFLVRAFDDLDAVEPAIASLVQVLKIVSSESVDAMLWHKYFGKCPLDVPAADVKRMKKADKIRLDSSVVTQPTYESVVVDLCMKFKDNPLVNWYSLNHMSTLTIKSPNRYVQELVRRTMASYTPVPQHVLERAVETFEHNEVFTNYADLKLREHQRTLYTCLKSPEPQLILIQAPTASGKTFSPVAIKRRHLFMSVRHVALEYARLCISAGRRIAFAFNCSSTKDIRVHYAAAINPILDKRTGRVVKVDNENGRNVDVMISDVASYAHAMDYMVGFNKADDLFLYFDDPTSVDATVVLPALAHNAIGTVVLSSATLPAMAMLGAMIGRYTERFHGRVVEIVTRDERKTTALLDPSNQLVLPHFYCETLEALHEMAQHVTANQQLLRYFDLGEIVRFLMKYPTTFADPKAMSIHSIKQAYLRTLQTLEVWPTEFPRTTVYVSTTRVTNEDAHTITGPSIYFTHSPAETARKWIEMSSIAPDVLVGIQNNLDFNEVILKKINTLQKDVADVQKADEKKMSMGKESRLGKEQEEKINQLQSSMRPVTLPVVVQGYVPRIGKQVSEDVMKCEVPPDYKLCLLMGIGILDDVDDVKYRELIKDLADKEALRFIIAKPVFGTGMNYQFHHLYVAPDLVLTLNSALQLFGRVDRGKVQQRSSIRMQGEVKQLFFPQENEDARTMNEAFFVCTGV